MTEKIGCVQHDCAECKARLEQPKRQWVSLTEDEIYSLVAAGHAEATTRLVNNILKGKNP